MADANSVSPDLATLGGAGWTPSGNPKYGGLAFPKLLAASAVKVDLTGSTNETTLATVVIPGGAMGPNGGLRIVTLWSLTNNANAKTLRYKLGASATLFQGAVASNASFNDPGMIVRNRNSAAVQVTRPNASTNVAGANANPVTTQAVDTSVDQSLTLTAQLGIGTDTITLESYEIWLVP